MIVWIIIFLLKIKFCNTIVNTLYYLDPKTNDDSLKKKKSVGLKVS